MLTALDKVPVRVQWTFAVALIAAVIATPVQPLAVLLVLGLAGATLILFRPGAGLGVAVFLVYSRLSDGLSAAGGDPPPLVLGVCAFLVGVALIRRIAFGDYVGPWSGPVYLLATFAGLVTLSLFRAEYPDRVIEELVVLGQDAVIVLTVLAFVNSAERLRIVVVGIVSAAGVLAVAAILQAIEGGEGIGYLGLAQAEVQHVADETSAPRAGGPGLGPNGLAQILLLALPLAVETAVRERRRLARGLAVVASGAILVAVTLTFSRMAIVAAVAMALYVVVRRAMHPGRLAVMGVGAMLFIALFAPGDYGARVESLSQLRSTETILAEPSFQGRLTEYLAAAMMMRDAPLSGVGWANFEPTYQAYARELSLDDRREERGPHSLALEFGAELGVLGLLWLVFVFAIALTGLRRCSAVLLRRGTQGELGSMAFGLEVALFGFMLTSLTRHLAFPRYMWLILGISLVVPRLVTADEPEMADER